MFNKDLVGRTEEAQQHIKKMMIVKRLNSKFGLNQRKMDRIPLHGLNEIESVLIKWGFLNEIN